MSQVDKGQMVVAWRLIGGFAFALFLCSASLFHQYLGAVGVYLYAPCLLAAVALAWYVAPIVHRRMSEKQALSLIILLLLGLGILFLVGYPVANSGGLGQGSDRDEALQLATIRLVRGEYPYYVRTYLDNPITPLPGALLLATPFALLGNAASQNLLWLTLFLIVARLFFLDTRYTLAMLLSLLLFAPIIVREVVTGSDFLANSLYILLSIVLFVHATTRTNSQLANAAAILLGIALSSRANFLFLLPVVFGALVQHRGWQIAMRYTTLVLLTCAAITLPFWLYDPKGFSPLHTIGEVAIFDTLVPGSSYLFPFLTALVALFLSCQKMRRWSTILRNCALVQATPILLGFLLPLIPYGKLYLYAGGSFGQSFLFFAALLFWLCRQGAEGFLVGQVGVFK
jgi:hypothetical protein